MTNPAVVRCSTCQQLLRLKAVHGQKYRISCPRCKSQFVYSHSGSTNPYSNPSKANPKSKASLFVLAVILLVADVAYPFVAVPILKKYGDSQFQVELNQLKENHKTAVARITDEKTKLLEQTTPETRRTAAEANYSRELNERFDYNSRYALSNREKAQLKMYALSKDKTMPVQDILHELAAMAAPQNSMIKVNYLNDKFQLDIDFDMSELSPGEKGSKTTHGSLDSLKREVQRLTYRVTNDVYTFSKNLGLDSISIGCRHHVKMQNQYGGEREENTVLYKIRLNKSSLAKLENNPFLDVYSTAQYMEILMDDFHNLKLITYRA